MAAGGVGPDAAKISQWLRDARDRARKTRRAVSDYLGVTEGAIQNWETPTMAALPPADKFLALVRLYGAEKQLRALLDESGGEARRVPAGAFRRVSSDDLAPSAPKDLPETGSSRPRRNGQDGDDEGDGDGSPSPARSGRGGRPLKGRGR